MIRKFGKKTLAFLYGTSPKKILVIPESTRFGNHLYFFLHAFIQRKRGERFYIQYIDNMEYWFRYFPNLMSFTIFSDEIKIYDQKVKLTHFYQHYNRDFDSNQLNDFIEQELMENEIFQNHNIEGFVINVRRGDFYTSQHKNLYGFDQIDYIKKAISNYTLSEIKNVYIISDDLVWCKENLDFLSNLELKIHYPKKQEPILDFLKICFAKQLIIPNSTFSYWGAYINQKLNSQFCITAPSFSAKHINSGKAIQLSPEWNVVEVSQ